MTLAMYDSIINTTGNILGRNKIKELYSGLKTKQNNHCASS
jgi:hypothetical protein